MGLWKNESCDSRKDLNAERAESEKFIHSPNRVDKKTAGGWRGPIASREDELMLQALPPFPLPSTKTKRNILKHEKVQQ